MTEPPLIRFHIDRRGRIVVENFTRECLSLAEALDGRALAARAAPVPEPLRGNAKEVS